MNLAEPIEGPSAWMRADIRPEDWRVELDPACLDEIRRTVEELRAYPLPTIVLDARDFAIPACRAAMARVRRMLDHDRRFAIVSRLPLDEMSAAEATHIYWLLSGMVSRPVAQKLDGSLVYDVLDSGGAAFRGPACAPTRPASKSAFTTTTPITTRRPIILGSSACAGRWRAD